MYALITYKSTYVKCYLRVHGNVQCNYTYVCYLCYTKLLHSYALQALTNILVMYKYKILYICMCTLYYAITCIYMEGLRTCNRSVVKHKYVHYVVITHSASYNKTCISHSY